MLVHSLDGNAVSLHDERIVVFMRALPLTVAALDCAESLLWTAIARATKEKPAGVWIIVSSDAGLSDRALLDRQRAVFERMAREPLLFVASSVHGTTVRALAVRAVSRSFSKAKPHMQLFSNVETAARWLSRSTRADERALLVEHDVVREACERSAAVSAAVSW
jgi:hypothetical protein